MPGFAATQGDLYAVQAVPGGAVFAVGRGGGVLQRDPAAGWSVTVAVVAPALEPLVDRLHDGVDALLVDPEDPAALRGAIEDLAGDPERRAAIAAAGRAEAQARWSWDEQLRRVMAALPSSSR